jgi:hypothetical protein
MAEELLRARRIDQMLTATRVYIELVDKDGGTVRYLEYPSLTELLEDWPDATGEGDEFSAWIDE